MLSARKTSSQIQREEELALKSAVNTTTESSFEVRVLPKIGRTVWSTKHFRRSEFVLEYCGELLSGIKDIKTREASYCAANGAGCFMYHFENDSQKYCIDATAESPKLGRLISHNIDRPNLITKLHLIDGKPRLLFFANRDIPPGEELSYDYGERNTEICDANPWLYSQRTIMKAWGFIIENSKVFLVWVTVDGENITTKKFKHGNRSREPCGPVVQLRQLTEDEQGTAENSKQGTIPVVVEFERDISRIFDISVFSMNTNNFCMKFDGHNANANDFADRFLACLSEIDQSKENSTGSAAQKRKVSVETSEASSDSPVAKKTKTPRPQMPVPESEENFPALMKKEQEEKEIGFHIIPTSLLSCGEQIFRKLDSDKVSHYEAEFCAGKYSSHYQPLAVEVSVSREEFDSSKLNSYRFCVLGGQNSAAACQRIQKKYEEAVQNNEDPETLGITEELFGRISKRMCVVYAKMSDACRLWVSKEHQQISKEGTDLVFQDIVRLARSLFIQYGKKYWKTMFKDVTDGTRLQMNSTKQNLVSYLATLPEDVFQLLEKMFHKHERNSLKHSKTLLQLTKHCIHKPELSYSSIQNIVSLPDDVIRKLLKDVTSLAITVKVSRKVSIQSLLSADTQMDTKARECKVLQAARELIVDETQLPWDEIEKRLGKETICEDSLRKHLGALSAVRLTAKGINKLGFSAKFLDFAARIRRQLIGGEGEKLDKVKINGCFSVLLDICTLKDSIEDTIDFVIIDVLNGLEESNFVAEQVKIVRDCNLLWGCRKLQLLVLANPRLLATIQHSLAALPGYLCTNWVFTACPGLEPYGVSEQSDCAGAPETAIGMLWVWFGSSTDELTTTGRTNIVHYSAGPKQLWREIVDRETAKTVFLTVNVTGHFAALALRCGKSCYSFHAPSALNDEQEIFKTQRPQETEQDPDSDKRSDESED